MTENIETLDPRQYIIIKGASVHNLKKIDVAIKRNSFTVITGLSGSGKSSLAFDTLYAEGQRRYVESLSSYARQFMGRMDKPEVEYIKGIAPAIAIEQKVNSRNPRSTVGTSTEIYDYLKLLFARIGKTYSPVSGNLVKKNNVSDVVDYISSLPAQQKVLLLAPLQMHHARTLKEELNVLLQKGFNRIVFGEKVERIEDIILLQHDEPTTSKKISEPKKRKATSSNSKLQTPNPELNTPNSYDIKIVVDRFVTTEEKTEEQLTRMADSVQTTYNEGGNRCIVESTDEAGNIITQNFSALFEADGIKFEEPSVHLFSFNNPYGACKNCEGFGSVIGIDEDLVIPDKSVSIYDGAIAPWRGDKMREWLDELLMHAYKFNFPIHRPYYELNEYDKKLLWEGNKHFGGINKFFKAIEHQTYKIQYRVMLSRYRGKTKCPECKGSRLRGDANYVKINGMSITDVVLMPVKKSFLFFQNITLNEFDGKIAGRLLTEITNRLQYINDVGLGYLTLNRLSNTLSGGESQRINLSTSLGSSLVGSMYILDEPSIGLHPRDTQRLITVLKSLQKAGNTLIVVEHDEEIMRNADALIDIGPNAGTHGGELVYEGDFKNLQRDSNSITAKYLTGKEFIHVPSKRRSWKNFVEIKGARENNLKGINVKIPLGVFTAVTGVSGSGKTSLIKKILHPALNKMIGGYGEQNGLFDRIEGDYQLVRGVEMIDQDPIGKSSRSNPVTYVKAYDEIRLLFSETGHARQQGLKPSHFSFNVDGGRCEMCHGEGFVTIEMQFMADIILKCESCHGKRFKEQILEIKFNDKGIDDVLNMTVDDAILFFSDDKDGKHTNLLRKIVSRLQPLADVGMGYITLGQPSSTLSGGEAQRVKLATYLTLGNAASNTLFIFDEPTTGLHFHDIRKLLNSFTALINNGNSVLVIEHNLDVIKCADWIIDLGPEGGDEGGHLLFEGTPEGLADCADSLTGKFLKEKL